MKDPRHRFAMHAPRGEIGNRRTIDALTIAYLSIVGFLILWHRRQVALWQGYVGLHLGLALLIWSWERCSFGRGWELLRDWYPLLGFPWLYQEVETLARAFGNWMLTSPIQSLEGRLFGGQPSLYLSQRLPWVWLSEYLHFCYFFYLLLLPLVGGYWYVGRKREAFGTLLYRACLTYYASYLFFILFPVDSPFYLFEPPGPPLAGHFFYTLVHGISSRGGARGGAFPSTHVAIGVVVLGTVWQRERQIAYPLVPIIGGLIFATVYGRFHYALDAIAGCLVGLAVVLGTGRK